MEPNQTTTETFAKTDRGEELYGVPVLVSDEDGNLLGEEQLRVLSKYINKHYATTNLNRSR